MRQKGTGEVGLDTGNTGREECCMKIQGILGEMSDTGDTGVGGVIQWVLGREE